MKSNEPKRRNWRLSLAVSAARLADRLVSYAAGGALMLILLFVILSIADISEFNARGMDNVKERDLKKLVQMNPDTVAWLTVDGTHIDNPVVQGKDNFEYLDLDFHRNYYAGGTLFLDCENSRNFSDTYNLIHGHHMSEGAMFGDLDMFLEEEFFKENHTGVLRTPDGDCRLEIIAAGTADAYNTGIYNVKEKPEKHIEAIMKSAVYIRKKGRLRSMLRSIKTGRRVLVLSTCTGAMDDSRTVVVCIMEPA